MRKDYIEAICKETGWSQEQTKKNLKHAKELGMTGYRYVQNKVWKLQSDDDIRLLALKLEVNAQKRKNRLEITKEATGWSDEVVKEKMDAAKKQGVPYYAYVKNQCWNYSTDELKELSIQLKVKELQQLEDDIKLVCKNTGWDEQTVKDKIKNAQEKGVPHSKYVSKEVYNLSDEEIAEFGLALKERSHKRLQNEEYLVKLVAKKAGWSEKQTRNRMHFAKEKGVSYLKYAQKACWTFNEKQITQLANILAIDKKRIEDNKKKYLANICAATNWSKAKAELEICKAKNRCGATYEDFLAFKFWEIPEEKWEEYVTLDMFNKMNLEYNDHLIGRKYLDDKAKFNETFSDLIHRKWFKNTNLSYDEFLRNIEGLNKVLVKPLAATQGLGIQKYECNISEDQNKELYETLISLPESIVEEFIVQNEDIKKYCDTSVNTIRITTINNNGNCEFLYALFRSGRGGVVDNFHAGGIAAAVDVETGVVCTNGADVNFDIYDIHPYCGLPLKGYKIPHWDKIKAACELASQRIPEVKLIGWDFAITEDGVDLIEGNSGAYIVAQLLYATEGIGLKSKIVDPYLNV